MLLRLRNGNPSIVRRDNALVIAVQAAKGPLEKTRIRLVSGQITGGRRLCFGRDALPGRNNARLSCRKQIHLITLI